MKKVFLAVYSLTAALGVALLAWIIPANTEESGFGLSPDLLPNILATVMLVTSVILAGKTLLGPDSGKSPIRGRELVRLTVFTAIFLGTFPLMSLIGFFAGGAVAMVLIQLMCGQRSIAWLLGLSLSLPGIFYVAMKVFLEVPLP